MAKPETPTTRVLEPGEVIYTSGWDHCYQIISGPFCRIHYGCCQEQATSIPSDPPIYVSYLTRPIGGTTTTRLLVRFSP